MTARGKPGGTVDDESISQWLDMAHEWIVKGFADLVEEVTDKLWERKK